MSGIAGIWGRSDEDSVRQMMRLLGIHQRAVSAKHLDYYLDEYTFRFNRRTSRSRGMLFYRLMRQAVATASVPYRQLVDANHKM